MGLRDLLYTLATKAYGGGAPMPVGWSVFGMWEAPRVDVPVGGGGRELIIGVEN